MNFNLTTALSVAENLLQIKAIKLEPKKPFQWSSGWKSPIYCDNRMILSHPPIRKLIVEELAKAVKMHYPNANLIAGVATGAIAHGVLVAQALDLPFVYVRPTAKAHGRKNQIEGDYKASQRVVVIEDLISTGGSSLKAVKAIRDEDMAVEGMVAIFTYGFDTALKAFEDANCSLTTLSDYNVLIKMALSKNYISEQESQSLDVFRKQPGTWGK